VTGNDKLLHMVFQTLGLSLTGNKRVPTIYRGVGAGVGVGVGVDIYCPYRLSSTWTRLHRLLITAIVPTPLIEKALGKNVIVA
jgi:hypothetical protein